MKHFHGKKLKDFLKLIRFQNLLIVAMTMIAMRYAIIRPLLESIPVAMNDTPMIMTRMELQNGWFSFMILVLSTIFLSAGGYVINDYFDIKTDIVNRGTVIVGNTIRRRSAMMFHNIFNILGVAGGFYVAAKISFIWMGVIFIVISGLLYFYSAAYKRQFLVGNLIVSFLTALVPFLVVLSEALPLFRKYSLITNNFPGVSLLFYWVGGFTLFAFMLTLIRELIKDTSDYEGDLEFGCRTLPIVAGMKTTRITIVTLSVITILMIYLVTVVYLPDTVTLAYISLFITLPFLWVIFKIISGRKKEDFQIAGTGVKLIMLAGILYSLIAGALITAGKVI